MIHDAEDLIHPEELRWINYYAARYDFVQTPVLALATPLRKLTHGVYCDEFAENHSRDMTVRAALGGFVPSCGVGTGYRRDALERLARASSNRLFEPEALTEDYENGLRLFRLGCSQAFVPISKSSSGGRDFVVTREFFPATWGAALRQRTRWVTGIALQGWQRFGWSGKPRGSLLAVAGSQGLARESAQPGGQFRIRVRTGNGDVDCAYRRGRRVWRWPPWRCRSSASASGVCCVGRIYGFVFALGVPVRAVYANALNTAATVQAVARYTWARVRGQPLKWLKTEHAYPARAALLAQKRKLGEILVSSGAVAAAELAVGAGRTNAGNAAGRVSGRLAQAGNGSAVSGAQLSAGPSARARSNRRLCRGRWRTRCPNMPSASGKCFPSASTEQNLFVASPEAPGAETAEALRAFTSLEIRFHLVTPAEFERLANALL